MISLFFYGLWKIHNVLTGSRNLGTVPNLVDLTTDEYSFVIKCPASGTCPCGEKLLRLAGEVARRAGGVSHPRIIPQGKQKGRYDQGRYDPPHGKQNGHYGRRKRNKRVVTTLRMANKTAIMAAARETKGALRPRKANRGGVRPRGCEPPPPLRGGKRFPTRPKSYFRLREENTETG